MSGRDCDLLVFVTGTNTDVGKTWWGAAVATILREHGVAVAARKPAQSFAPHDTSRDADALAAATGEGAEEVSPPHRWYPIPLAPPMAAEALGRPSFRVAELADETGWTGHREVVLVEGAGGPRSPIADDGDNVDLARALGVDHVVLVAEAGLGTINAVRLCASAITPLHMTVALNRYLADDDLHARNHAWLVERAGLDVVTSPGDLADALVTRARKRAARSG